MSLYKFSLYVIYSSSTFMVLCLLFCTLFYNKIPKEEKLLYFFLLTWVCFDLSSYLQNFNNLFYIPILGCFDIAILGGYFYRRLRAKWILYLIGSVIALSMVEVYLLIRYYNVYMATFSKSFSALCIVVIVFYQVLTKELNKQQLVLYYAMLLYFSIAFLQTFIVFYLIELSSSLKFIFYLTIPLFVALLVFVLTKHLWQSARVKQL